MKPIFVYAFAAVLIILSIVAGYVIYQNTVEMPRMSASAPTAQNTSTSGVAAGEGRTENGTCPVPALTFDNGQQITVVQSGFGFGNDTGSYTLPFGSVIYHTPDGITRVFDKNGTQILIANDSDREIVTPGGQKPSTRVVQVPSGSVMQEDGNTTDILLNGSCIAIIVEANTSFVPRTQVCHCPMKPVLSATTTPAVTPDDGLCHC